MVGAPRPTKAADADAAAVAPPLSEFVGHLRRALRPQEARARAAARAVRGLGPREPPAPPRLPHLCGLSPRTTAGSPRPRGCIYRAEPSPRRWADHDGLKGDAFFTHFARPDVLKVPLLLRAGGREARRRGGAAAPPRCEWAARAVEARRAAELSEMHSTFDVLSASVRCETRRQTRRRRAGRRRAKGAGDRGGTRRAGGRVCSRVPRRPPLGEAELRREREIVAAFASGTITAMTCFDEFAAAVRSANPRCRGGSSSRSSRRRRAAAVDPRSLGA